MIAVSRAAQRVGSRRDNSCTPKEQKKFILGGELTKEKKKEKETRSMRACFIDRRRTGSIRFSKPSLRSTTTNPTG